MTLTPTERAAAIQQQVLRQANPAPSLSPPMPMLARHAVDVSNFTAFFGLTSLITWKNDHDIGLVIVQSLDAGRFPQSRTVQQLIGCRAADIATDLYVYPFFANGVSDCHMRLNEGLLAGVPIRRVWLDVEDVDPSQRAWTPQQRADMVIEWLAICDAFPARVKPAGIYTGRWYWASPDYMANSTVFADRPLWDANYDGIDDTRRGFVPYGGWTVDKLAIKQYRGTSSLAGIGGVDLDVLGDAERALV